MAGASAAQLYGHLGQGNHNIKDPFLEPTRPLPSEKIDTFSFYYKIKLGLAQIRPISFDKDMIELDLRNFITENDGMKELCEKLKCVMSIKILRLHDALEIKQLLDSLDGQVWLNVEYLEITHWRKFLANAESEAITKLKLLQQNDKLKVVVTDTMELLQYLPNRSFNLDASNVLTPELECFFKKAKQYTPNVFLRLVVMEFDLRLCASFHDARAIPASTALPSTKFQFKLDASSKAKAVELAHFEENGEFIEAQMLQRFLTPPKQIYFDLFKENVARERTLENIKIAVIDTGIDYFHPQLNTIQDGKSYITGENWFTDAIGHGTHCAGIVTSTAPGAKLYVAKVFNKYGDCENPDHIAAAIDWAIEKDVDIISMSLGGGPFNRNTYNSILEAEKRGIIIVVSAGNEGSIERFNVTFPATVGVVIRVGSHTEEGVPSKFSSVGGPRIDVSGPGSKIISTWPGGEFKSLSGTSMAAPYIAAVCALLLACDIAAGGTRDRWNTHVMKGVLQQCSFNPAQYESLGNGLLQLKAIWKIPGLLNHYIDEMN